MYDWTAWPSFPVRLSGVSSSRERAQAAAAAVLLGDSSLAAVTLSEARTNLTGRASAYEPTGRRWTGRRADGEVAWTAARSFPQELAS
jgi:hypothetical protein